MDLYNIPGDNGTDFRLKKFVEYQHNAPAVDPPTYTAYAKHKGLDPHACVDLAWYHSLTYCELTAAILLENRVDKAPARFWKENKDKLIFGSARKYVKNMDWFVPLMQQYTSFVGSRPYDWLEEIAGDGTPQEKYENIERELNGWKFMGRFSIDLFTEAIITMGEAGLIPLRIENNGYDWRKTSNLTSGLLNIFYLDEEANDFDDTGKLPIPAEELDKMLDTVLEAVRETYPDQETNKVSVVNKICSFRNLFKAARYGGFHHDRQLQNLKTYQKIYPEYRNLWKLFYKIRLEIFPVHMLGEHNNWRTIRNKRKKLWLQEGRTGCEQNNP